MKVRKTLPYKLDLPMFQPITVLLDTNVFVAAHWAPGSASARVIRACRKGRQARAHYSDPVREEVMHILRHAHIPAQYIRQVEEFWQVAERVEPAAVGGLRTADPDDQKFLEAAAGGDTDFLVTNDDHLLTVGFVGRTEILTPRSMMAVLDSFPSADRED